MRYLISTLLAAAALATSGCVSILPEPMIPSALVQLPSDRAKAPSAPLLADVAVFPPESSRAFAGADIAVRSDQELIYLADVRWSDAAPGLLQGAVVNALSQAQGPGRAVLGQLGADVDYDVRWRIIDLSVSKETGPVHVEVQVNLMRKRHAPLRCPERLSRPRARPLIAPLAPALPLSRLLHSKSRTRSQPL